MDIDGLVFPDIDVIPRIIVDILLGIHFVRMRKQQLQDFKFLLGQRNFGSFTDAVKDSWFRIRSLYFSILALVSSSPAKRRI